MINSAVSVKRKQQTLLHQLPIETLQIIITFLIGNLNLNFTEIIEQYFKNDNTFTFELPNLQNVISLLSLTNVHKKLLQQSNWINLFWKNCCNTLDFIFYYNVNEEKRREQVGGGDLTDKEIIEIKDIHKLILFSELGIVDNSNENENKENIRFCKEWYNSDNAKKYFTKRMELLLIKDENENCKNYFISFLSKIFHLVAPIVNTRYNYNAYLTSNDTVINALKYYKNNYSLWNNDNILGLILDGEISKSLKEKNSTNEEEYLKLKRSLQNLFYLSVRSDFKYWNCFRKDTTIFNSILILILPFNNKIDLTDINFNNVRFLILTNYYDIYRNFFFDNGKEIEIQNALQQLLQKKHFPKLNHLLLEGKYFDEQLKNCDVFENLEILELICTDSDDYLRNGNTIFKTLKVLLPYCLCLKFCIIPQYLLVNSSYSASFENIKDIYNLKDRKCVISIQNDSYTCYYDRCWE
ncbi:hypothetical protein ABK040_011642 [Willaertia magna]